jgi:8-oxo-dGTP pyrophosphatase MutT (NUDIX family)
MYSLHKQANCSNCGVVGHTFRQCLEPVLSYGLIVFRPKVAGSGLEVKLCSSEPTLNGSEEPLQVLMICRKDSLRFVEFIRGKYNLRDETYIKQLLCNMTAAERTLLATYTFAGLWNHVWGTINPRNYRTDFEQSQDKFNELNSSGTLVRLLAETNPLWTTPEWGFPKGRRNMNESDLSCAIRECIEETGLERKQLFVFDSVEPFAETFYGDNKVNYSHKYYPALVAANTAAKFEIDSPHMSREISDIRWMDIEEALAIIRPESPEKKEILSRAAGVFRSFCAFRNEKYFAAAARR